jgi:glyoxylase-like metal-dependent hydrolase (beta-lactamase superfamily II)
MSLEAVLIGTSHAVAARWRAMHPSAPPKSRLASKIAGGPSLLEIPAGSPLPPVPLSLVEPRASKDLESRAEAPIAAWSYDWQTTVLRQSITTHFEAPFIKLLMGSSRALLIDTGTGDVDVRHAVDVLLQGRNLELVVAHSHAHTDHVGGDAQFVGRSHTSIVGHSLLDVESAFGLGPSGMGSIDLGDRVVDVLLIPGHEATHIAFYDRDTQLLLTGDTLYPGRLYVRDWAAYCASIARLVRFVDDGHPIMHVIGAHIELSADNVEYPEGATEHPNEHPLPLGESHLRDLLSTVDGMANAPLRTKRESYVVVPLA